MVYNIDMDKQTKQDRKMNTELFFKERHTGYDLVPYYVNPIKQGCIAFGHIWIEEDGEYVCSTCGMTYKFFNDNTQKSGRSNQ